MIKQFYGIYIQCEKTLSNSTNLKKHWEMSSWRHEIIADDSTVQEKCSAYKYVGVFWFLPRDFPFKDTFLFCTCSTLVSKMLPLSFLSDEQKTYGSNIFLKAQEKERYAI